MIKVAVVEDDRSLQRLLGTLLTIEGFSATLYSSAEEALEGLKRELPDLILLDIMLPGISGFKFQEIIKEQDIPVIFLTAKTHVEDRLTGLKLGADDYITKPFHNEELILKVKAILRRVGSLRAEGELRLKIAEDSKTIYFENERLDLTTTECALLAALIKNRGRVLSRNELLEAMWAVTALETTTRAVDVNIQRIRKKLAGKIEIVTVYGSGYVLGGDKT